MYKILVIEDDSKLRKNICELLENEDYKVEHAENGLIGVEMARTTYPDLIISDIMMPKMNGFEVLKELLKDEETASIPLIFLTAKAEVESFREGMNLGADDYLFKPFRITDLLTAIETRLKKKELATLKIREMQEQISRKIPHELRTPLVPILGLSELIDEEMDITEIKEMAKIIRANGKRLHQKVEKFILYNDLIIEEKKTKNKAGSLSNTLICEEIIYQCLSEIENKLKPTDRVRLKVEPASIILPEYFFTTIIKELIENGLKYSEENTFVTVEGIKENNNYKLTISDLGRGMTEREINLINAFEKFGKQQFTEAGFGLGLTIVKKILDSHNCKFLINSETNKFTRCDVLIPLY
ncbi:MAG: response regulator [Bacteroidetes bacterium]|nr:response regulator [Bacteroidota bacterium]MBU1115629.1 response regulator [Bacteroidota bacterium]MBU1797599.1 response regulator [Bacteroidota bacterium]